jgi:hypothetical protein
MSSRKASYSSFESGGNKAVYGDDNGVARVASDDPTGVNVQGQDRDGRDLRGAPVVVR